MIRKKALYLLLVTLFICSQNVVNGMENFFNQGFCKYYSPSLHQLIKDNNVQEVAALLQSGSNANEIENGITPLHRATEYRHPEIVQLLCSYKADANGISHVTGSGWSPLHTAAYCCHNDFIIDILLSAGAHINAKDVKGYTPLILAAANNNAYAVELLCFHGADVNKADSNGFTPLHSASAKGYAKIVSILLNTQAAIHKKTKSGLTALDIAQKKGHLQVTQIIDNHLRKEIFGELMPEKKQMTKK